jgi:hypothetical protein
MVKIAKVFLGFIGFSVLLLAPQDARGLLGQALSVDGVGDCIEIADAPDLYLRDALTVSGWFRADSFKAGSDGWQALFWKGAAPDHAPYNKREFGLWLHESGMLEFDGFGAGGGRIDTEDFYPQRGTAGGAVVPFRHRAQRSGWLYAYLLKWQIGRRRSLRPG